MKRYLAIFLVLAALLSVPALALTEDEMAAAMMDTAVECLSACMAEDMTDLEKLTVLHDWLALRTDYGATLRSDTAYGGLVEGTGNCVGYAAGLAYLAELAGLDGAYTYSEELDHAWTLATLDGTRYFTDCTWDDGKYQKLGLIRHSYFLFDQENARQTGHYGWDSGEEVPGGPLEDVPWTAAVSRVIFQGDWAYYLDGEFRLLRCDRATWGAETLLSLPDRWPDTDPEDGREPEIYSGLILLRDRLYFNTPDRIWCYYLKTGAARAVMTPDLPEGTRIYGVAVRDGKLCYSVSAGPTDLDYDVIDTYISARSAWGC